VAGAGIVPSLEVVEIWYGVLRFWYRVVVSMGRCMGHFVTGILGIFEGILV